MKTSMVLLFVLAILSAALPAQQAPTTPITPTPITPTPPPYWLNPPIRILGNVTNGFLSVEFLTRGGPRLYPAHGRFLNFSFRGFVRQDDHVIAGFVVSEGNRVLMIRAVGPSLSIFGLSGVLPRPRLELFNASGNSLAVAVPWSTTNANIRNELRNAAADVGAFPLKEGSEDQVLLVFLERGAYTCVVSGLNGSTGVVLVEGYEVPRTPSS